MMTRASRRYYLREPAVTEVRKMNRRTAIRQMATFLLTTASVAQAQQQVGKVPRIGVLRNDTPALFASRNGAFRSGIRELGYVEGQNLRLEYRFAEGRPDRLPELAAELV